MRAGSKIRRMSKKRTRRHDGCSVSLPQGATLSLSSLLDSIARNGLFYENLRHSSQFIGPVDRQLFGLRRRRINVLSEKNRYNPTHLGRRMHTLRRFIIPRHTASNMILFAIFLLTIILNHSSFSYYVSAWLTTPCVSRRGYQKTMVSSLLKRCMHGTAEAESFWIRKADDFEEEEDVPRPTENGGYSHTQASRAKISAANKGKTPWNKGVQRSEEVKARIAAGVRAKNRERFLLKLQEMGISEKDYEEQRRKERNQKEAEKRARRTEKGGYRPTEETKRKISEILKQKFAAGEIAPRFVQPVNVRRGFTHSEETRQKISESLRKRWATDSDYRAKMVEMSNRVNSSEDVRRKISESLKQKWQSDDEFRQEMLTKIATRKPRTESPHSKYVGHHYTDDHRARISAAMKAKWQDTEYREKTLQSLASRRVASSPNSLVDSPVDRKVLLDHPTNRIVSNQTFASPSIEKRKSASNTNGVTTQSPPRTKEKSPKPPKVVANDVVAGIRALQPRTSSDSNEKSVVRSSNVDNVLGTSNTQPNRNIASDSRRNVASIDTGDSSNIKPSSKITDAEFEILVEGGEMQAETPVDKKSSKGTASTEATTSGGNVDLLKAERRDLYDLLYGDDDRSDEEEYDNDTAAMRSFHGDENIVSHKDSKSSGGSTISSILSQLDDENLDTFDPYGLDDF